MNDEFDIFIKAIYMLTKFINQIWYVILWNLDNIIMLLKIM